MTTTSNPHIGSGLDDLLEADGLLAKARTVAVKRVCAWQADQSESSQLAAADDGVLKLRVVFESDEDGWVTASCPSLPGCHSQGRTRDEALANIQEAIEGYLTGMFPQVNAPSAASRREAPDR